MRQGRIWLWAHGGAKSGKGDRAVITFSGISKWLGLYYSAAVWLRASKGSFQDSSISNIKFSSVYNISCRFGEQQSAALIKPIGNSALPQCVSCSSIFDLDLLNCLTQWFSLVISDWDPAGSFQCAEQYEIGNCRALLHNNYIWPTAQRLSTPTV